MDGMNVNVFFAYEWLFSPIQIEPPSNLQTYSINVSFKFITWLIQLTDFFDRMEKKPWEKPGSVGGAVPLWPEEPVVCYNCSKVRF